MLKVDYVLLADNAHEDKQGKLNIIGIFQVINASDVPAVHVRVSIVSRFSGMSADANKKYMVETRIEDDKGETILSIKRKEPLRLTKSVSEPNRVGAHLLLNLDLLPLPAYGIYHIRLYLNGKRAGGTTYRVVAKQGNA